MSTKPDNFRLPPALSPSALARWEDRREEFFERYISPVRTPRQPQVNYMAVGSAFDAFVKSQIHSDIYGKAQTKGSQFDRQKLFESQVEEHIRDEVWERAEFLFNQYRMTGSYADLMSEIHKSNYAPEMEFKVSTEVNGVPIMGYPDLRYITKGGIHVIADFKVNGAFSNHGVSPLKGYKVARSIKRNGEIKRETHKDYVEEQLGDITISKHCLGSFSRDWATQLTMYAWCLGETPGDENFVTRMEQIACRPTKSGDINVKIASHVSRISQNFQLEVMMRLCQCWQFVTVGHIFTDFTFEENLEHCKLLIQKMETPLGLHGAVANRYLTEKGTRFK